MQKSIHFSLTVDCSYVLFCFVFLRELANYSEQYANGILQVSNSQCANPVSNAKVYIVSSSCACKNVTILAKEEGHDCKNIDFSHEKN